MTAAFEPDARPTLIGSLPLTNHREAIDLVFDHVPDVPIWPQLPVYPGEGMVPQFLPGLPGAVSAEDRWAIDVQDPGFDAAMLAFYEMAMAVESGETAITDTAWGLTPESAKGYFELESRLEAAEELPTAIKCQVTGPFTFATGIKDAQGQAVFFDPSLRDMAVKAIALHARWQVRRLARFDRPVICFMDEPALAGFGSSEFISVSRDDVATVFAEVVDAIHAEGGLAGVHVCANTDWNLILDSDADVVNFDAFGYTDRLLLYADALSRFIDRGGLMAWGLVPTLEPDQINAATVENLLARWTAALEQMAAKGMDPAQVRRQSLITPSCGCGSLTEDLARTVLALTRDLSAAIRQAN